MTEFTMMQGTRRQIIDLLKKEGKATVDEMAEKLSLTPMAIRHHLNVLQRKNLVEVTTNRRQNGPGRPQQVYHLTETANELFPTDYHHLAESIISEIKALYGIERLNEILQRVATSLIKDAPPPIPGQSFGARVAEVAEFLEDRGFLIDLEETNGGYYLHNLTCPYHHVARTHHEICNMDSYLFHNLLQVHVERISCIAATDQRCTYYIQLGKNETEN